ncbi:GH3 auxin-responsive promoter [Corchorus capsularis]|uniref:GH3 auxin-responsive promoter n=1 Tax=Corchorus capsularis TaxID=210143 RepID=A0A1R3H0C7_COCAP|nr:GH3 auxin-responsive promoter [Corchorus capsularis]
MDVDEEEFPNDRLVDLVNVKVGCYYELVVTTFAVSTDPSQVLPRPTRPV